MIAVCKGILNIFYILIITVGRYGMFFKVTLHKLRKKIKGDKLFSDILSFNDISNLNVCPAYGKGIY